MIHSCRTWNKNSRMRFNAMKKMAEKLSQVRQRSAQKVRRRDLWSDERTEFSDSRFEIRISEAAKNTVQMERMRQKFYLSVNPGRTVETIGKCGIWR